MKKTSRKVTEPVKLTNPAKNNEPAAPEVNPLIEQVTTLLSEGQAARALETLSRARVSSPWASNALGVCLLRLGNAKSAVDVFRGLVLAAQGVSLRPDVPGEYKRNFAAALLASGNVAGGLDVLSDLGAEGHPTVQALRGAVARWKANLSFWQRLRWYLGGEMDIPVVFDFPLGEVE
ncbi:MAG: hypothetical protein L0Z62_25045 [Gemmataceae bacterium]|nr:hypothetical protein [Gemmataceae bacterium]